MKWKCVVFAVVSCSTLIAIITKLTPPAYSIGNNTSSVVYEDIKSAGLPSLNTVHLAVIIAGSRSYNQALTMIKSVFLSMGRWDGNVCSTDQNTSELESNLDMVDLEFHLIVDDSTYQRLQPALLVWQPRRVSFYFYSLQRYMSELNGLEVSHHSGSSSMVKLLIAQILPIEVGKVVVLDADMLFISAVQELWNYFRHFDEHQIFGMVQEQNPYYRLKMGRHYWPQLNRGYNAGLMLIDLARLRKLNWEVVWRKCSRKLRSAWKRLPTGEQDIYNAVFQSNRQLIYDLPCNWNYQLSPVASDKICPVRWPSVHGNSSLLEADADEEQLIYIKMAHFNAALKPEDTYPKPWYFPDPVRNDLPLTRVQVAHRFLTMYYSLRNMSLRCFW